MVSKNYNEYLEVTLIELSKQWPNNRAINIVCHGHSVPSGYFATPFVDTFNSYPHLLHKTIKERFPFSCVNVIVTAIGGENSVSGNSRFESDVLTHKPDVITIDYSLNDRSVGLKESFSNWSKMIESGLKKNIKIILLTPSWDKSYFIKNENWEKLVAHANQVRELARHYEVGLCDTFSLFEKYVELNDLSDLLSHVNHPNRKGHELIANGLAKFFLAK